MTKYLTREEFPVNPIHAYHVHTREKCEDHIVNEDATKAEILLARGNDRFFNEKTGKWICAVCATALRIIP